VFVTLDVLSRTANFYRVLAFVKVLSFSTFAHFRVGLDDVYSQLDNIPLQQLFSLSFQHVIATESHSFST